MVIMRSKNDFICKGCRKSYSRSLISLGLAKEIMGTTKCMGCWASDLVGILLGTLAFTIVVIAISTIIYMNPRTEVVTRIQKVYVPEPAKTSLSEEELRNSLRLSIRKTLNEFDVDEESEEE